MPESDDNWMAEIAAGVYDTYLRAYADSVRDYGHAVVIGFGHEMNGHWYSGAGGTSTRHQRIHDGLAAHRLGVPRRGRLQCHLALDRQPAEAHGTRPIGAWWPGGNYVTWVGIDGYYVRPSDTFQSVFGQTINQVRNITEKPILLSETGVSPRVNRFAKIANLSTTSRTRTCWASCGSTRTSRLRSLSPGLADRR